MTGDVVGAPAVAHDLGQLLLDAKLTVPPPRPGAVSRAALIEKARSSACRVVGITAPAGYGKSTLLTEWARAEDRPVAWVSLDRFDDDPATLLALLAAAYGRIDSGGAEVTAGIGGIGMSVLGRAAPRLASTFSASPVPFVIMLDDLHELRSSGCHDVLGVVLARIPVGSQIVTSSRFEQPHLSRLRASGDALEFVADDLALDAEGAQQIFSKAEVSLPDDVAAVVTRQTEGWPVGVYLAAVIAKESGDPTLTVTGDDRYVADYLYRESLSQQPEDIQRFLRRTAVLDQLSGRLCNAVLEESGAPERLRHIEASGLFLIPLDRRREWFRYHGLFREFLLSELRRTEADIIVPLHRRAADWYLSHGAPVLALEQLLHTSERPRAAQLAAELTLSTYNAGGMSTVQRWLTALGDDGIESYPPLAVLSGWITALTGDARGAHRWAEIVDAATFSLVPADGSASFDSARSMLRALMCAKGPEAMLGDASFAVAQEGEWSPWRDTALCELAEAHLLMGNIDEARTRFAESSAFAATMGNTEPLVVSESELALLAMDRGDWDEAAGHVKLALDTIDQQQMHDYMLSLLAYAAAARLAVHRGDAQEARVQLGRAMRARPSATYAVPFIAVRLRLQLAKVCLAIAEPTTARHLLREIDDVLIRRPDLGSLTDEVREIRDRASEAAVDGSGGSPLSPAELRLLPYLQTHLSIRQIAERLFISRNTVATQVSAIYRKLGVSSRNDAVQHATAMGLLGG